MGRCPKGDKSHKRVSSRLVEKDVQDSLGISLPGMQLRTIRKFLEHVGTTPTMLGTTPAVPGSGRSLALLGTGTARTALFIRTVSAVGPFGSERGYCHTFL